ncbi:hypothetical protein C7S14_0765 [Burkholderia cepacia]|nr:hypothetical protein C7S14_0765 [Burkholderia cepacia]
MHAHGWHGRPAQRCAPRVPGAAAAAKRPGPGTAWRTGVMSNGVVVRDRGIAILAIDRWKCILVERASITGAGLARIDGALPNNVVIYLRLANNERHFPRTGRRSRVRPDAARPAGRLCCLKPVAPYRDDVCRARDNAFLSSFTERNACL